MHYDKNHRNVYVSGCSRSDNKNSADAYKPDPCDPFRGQSRSSNMVQFGMLGMVSH